MNLISTFYTVKELKFKAYEAKSAKYTGQSRISVQFRLNKAHNLIAVRLTYITEENAFPFFIDLTGELTAQCDAIDNAKKIADIIVRTLIPILYDNIRGTLGGLTLMGGHQSFLGSEPSEIIANYSTNAYRNNLKKEAEKMLNS